MVLHIAFSAGFSALPSVCLAIADSAIAWRRYRRAARLVDDAVVQVHRLDPARPGGRCRQGEAESLDDDGAALREMAACLAPMLSQLPPVYQESIRIVDLEGTTQQEAARRAGGSLSGMKSRVQRGRQRLREVFEACCRIDLDRRGGISAYTARHPDACGCGDCGDR